MMYACVSGKSGHEIADNNTTIVRLAHYTNIEKHMDWMEFEQYSRLTLLQLAVVTNTRTTNTTGTIYTQ